MNAPRRAWPLALRGLRLSHLLEGFLPDPADQAFPVIGQVLEKAV